MIPTVPTGTCGIQRLHVVCTQLTTIVHTAPMVAVASPSQVFRGIATTKPNLRSQISWLSRSLAISTGEESAKMKRAVRRMACAGGVGVGQRAAWSRLRVTRITLPVTHAFITVVRPRRLPGPCSFPPSEPSMFEEAWSAGCAFSKTMRTF